MIIFGLVRFLSKKSNQTKFFFKKTKTGSNRLVSVQVFGKKPIQTGLARFFFCFFGSVRLQAYKTETNRSVFSKF
jgi:hypothetical protein